MILIRSKISSTLGKSFLVSPSQEEQIKKIDGIASYKIIEERVLFVFEDKQVVTYLKELIQISVK
jgi:lipoprotein-releasing system permease protein